MSTSNGEPSPIDWESWVPEIKATLMFVVRDFEVLLIEKQRGIGAGKINGPGGKIDPGETPLESAVRETQEELLITPHDPRRFVEQVDFITTPGYLDGPGAREAAGLPPGTGPYKVVTDLAVLGFDEASRRMQIESLHAGVALDDVTARTGFELLVAEPLATTPAPDATALRVLREEVDPHRYIIGRA